MGEVNPTSEHPSAETVERYLDQLFDQLAGTGAAGRRALAEAEDHLAAATGEGLARGLDQATAEREAVARFGRSQAFAFALRRTYTEPLDLLRQGFVALWFVGAVAAVAIGASGFVAWGFGRLFGLAFVAGDAPGQAYTAARCAEFLAAAPHAGSCTEAAAIHHFGEVVDYRVTLGVLGILALLALLGARRFTEVGTPAWTPNADLLRAILVAMFGVAGLLLLGPTLPSLLLPRHADGLGADISGGVVAAVIAVSLATWALLRARRAPA